MAVAAGNKGKITLRTSGADADTVIAEMGSWSISGPTLNMVPHSAFGDERGRQKPGMMTAQTVSFDGYADFSTEVGTNIQSLLITYLSSGTPIYPSSHLMAGTSDSPNFFKLWECDDSSLEGHGWWTQEKSTSVSDRKAFITGLEVGQNMDGVGTIGFTMAITGGNLIFQTSST